MADSAFDPPSYIAEAGIQTIVSDPGIAQPDLDALELRISTRMEELLKELLKEQTKELKKLMLHQTTRTDLAHGQVVERIQVLGDRVWQWLKDPILDRKAPTFEGFIFDSPHSPKGSEDQLIRSSSNTHQRLTKVMQPQQHSWLQKAIQSSIFRTIVMVLIVLQSAVLGWESNFAVSLEKERLEGSRSDSALPERFSLLEHVFMILFLLEWSARILAWRLKFFDYADKEFFAWNMFDTILILGSFLIFVDIKVSWLRSIRLFRMARMLRILRFAKKLRKMSYALIRAIDSMFWLMVLLSLMLYIFSLITMRAAYDYMQDVETAQHHELKCGDPGTEEDLPMILRRFGSLQSTMLSLLATFTGGVEWDSLFKPIMSVSPLYSIIVVFFVCLFVFAVMNVVTGVFVEDAMNIAQIDESLAIAEAIESEEAFESDVQRLMSTIDEDQDGLLSSDQLLEALKKKSVQHWLAVRDIDLSAEDARRIMQIFGEHISSGFDSKVLLKILKKIRGAARRTDLIVTAHDLRDGQKELKRSLEAIETLYEQMALLESRMRTHFFDKEQNTPVRETVHL